MADSISTNDLLARLCRSVELLIQLKLHEVRGEKNQKEIILLMDSAGFSPGEIGKFLGTSTNNVSPVLSRARQANKGK